MSDIQNSILKISVNLRSLHVTVCHATALNSPDETMLVDLHFTKYHH